MNKLGHVVGKIEDWISGSLLVTGLLILFLQVIMRYILDIPTTWHDEIARYLVIWGVLLGSAVALRDNEHIRVEVLYNFLPKSMKKWVNQFANLTILLFFFVMIVYGFQLVETKFVSGENSTSGLLPLWIVYSILPLSGVIMALRTIVQMVQIKKPLEGENNLTD